MAKHFSVVCATAFWGCLSAATFRYPFKMFTYRTCFNLHQSSKLSPHQWYMNSKAWYAVQVITVQWLEILTLNGYILIIYVLVRSFTSIQNNYPIESLCAVFKKSSSTMHTNLYRKSHDLEYNSWLIGTSDFESSQNHEYLLFTNCTRRSCDFFLWYVQQNYVVSMET